MNNVYNFVSKLNPFLYLTEVGLNGEDFQPKSSQFTCAQCSKQPEKLLRCSRCKEVKYCDQKCQKAGWKTHKLVCGAPNPQFIDGEGKSVMLSQEQFKKKTGAFFNPKAQVSNAQLKEMQNTFLSLNESAEVFKDCIAMIDENEMGYGLVATKDIPKGVLFAPFGGEVFKNEGNLNVSQTLRSKLYTIQGEKKWCYDPSKVTGYGGMANDGSPNCDFVSLWKKDGIPLQQVLESSRKIAKGEKIYVDYGSAHPIKYGPYIIDETSYQKLKTVIKKSSDLIKSGNSDEILTQLYVLGTPAVFVRMHLEGHVDPKETHDLLGSNLPDFKSREPHDGLISYPFYFLIGLDKLKGKNAWPYFKNMSQHSMVELMTFIGQCNQDFTLDELALYGKMGDQVYEYLNGAKIGTSLNTSEKNKLLGKTKLDTQKFIKDFKKLPKELQTQMKKKIQASLDGAKQFNLSARVKTFDTLLKGE